MLIVCPECELQVSDKASVCPHCGYPMKENAKSPIYRRSNKRRRLPNSFGQISEIKNRHLRKPFRAMVTVGKTETGRPICKPLKPDSYFETYNDAYAALVAYNKNPYSLEPAITVKELYEKWSKEHFKTLKGEYSAQAIELAWRYCSSLYGMRAADIRGYHIKGCMDEGTAEIRGKTKKANATTKAKIKSIFNLMLDYAVEREIVDRNHARSFHLSGEVKQDFLTVQKEHIPFSDEEFSILWQERNREKLIDVLLIQCYSGWRPQELVCLELEKVDLENGTFRGGMKTSAGTDRIVPIHSKILPIVKKWYSDSKAFGSKYLFTYSSDGKELAAPLTYWKYASAIRRICETFSFNPNHRPHDGRVHFVTMAKKYGVDEYAIKFIVGHAVSDITERVYTKRERDWLKTEIEKIK